MSLKLAAGRALTVLHFCKQKGTNSAPMRWQRPCRLPHKDNILTPLEAVKDPAISSVLTTQPANLYA